MKNSHLDVALHLFQARQLQGNGSIYNRISFVSLLALFIVAYLAICTYCSFTNPEIICSSLSLGTRSVRRTGWREGTRPDLFVEIVG